MTIKEMGIEYADSELMLAAYTKGHVDKEEFIKKINKDCAPTPPFTSKVVKYGYGIIKNDNVYLFTGKLEGSWAITYIEASL